MAKLRTRRRWKKVQAHLQDDIDAVVAMLNERVQENDRIGGIQAVVVDCRRGWCFSKDREFSVPLAAYMRGFDQFLWYTAHELSHIYADLYSNSQGHDRAFYEWFVKICPREVQKLELQYITRARAYIITREDE